MIIIGMILVISILLLLSKNCKKHEGFQFGSNRTLITELTSSKSLTQSNLLADTNTAEYRAFINTADNVLKIAKKTTPTEWKVIWSSNLSDPKWKGTPVTFSAAKELKIGDFIIGSHSEGTSAKLTSNGDLVIVKDGDVIVWSLVSHELQSSKKMLDEYLNRGSRIYASTELDLLKKKLHNFNQYITGVAPKDGDKTSELAKAHAMIVSARRQLDFDLSELNGVSNSKVILSQNGLNSSLYANLMATTLVAGLFILIATRGNQ